MVYNSSCSARRTSTTSGISRTNSRYICRAFEVRQFGILVVFCLHRYLSHQLGSRTRISSLTRLKGPAFTASATAGVNDAML